MARTGTTVMRDGTFGGNEVEGCRDEVNASYRDDVRASVAWRCGVTVRQMEDGAKKTREMIARPQANVGKKRARIIQRRRLEQLFESQSKQA